MKSAAAMPLLYRYLPFLLVLLALPAKGQDTYTNPIIAPQAHDPSVIRLDDGTYYVYSPEDTWFDGEGQRHVPIYSSRDLVDWIYVGDAFEAAPAWKPDSDYWAVGVYERGGTFYMYYSVWDFEFIFDPNPCIGLATAPSPEGPWTELGRPVFCSNDVGAPSSIDPFVWDDGETQTLFWGTLPAIYVATLSADGTEIVTEPVIIARDIEGAYVTQREGYYYLWGSSGTCCLGIFSSYRTHVGRSASLTGPYVNRNGQDLRNALGKVVLEGDPIFPGPWDWIGPGHNAVATDDAGDDWLLYHAIPTATPGTPGGIGGTTREILMDKIRWQNGWPEVNNDTPSSRPRTAPAIDLDVRVTLEPTSPTTLPAGGGQIETVLRVENTSGAAQEVDVWLDARVPGGRLTGPLFGPVAVTLAPDEVWEQNLAKRLGAGAPGGTYWVQARAGAYPDATEDAGAFNFLKEGTSRRSGDGLELAVTVMPSADAEAEVQAAEVQAAEVSAQSGRPGDEAALSVWSSASAAEVRLQAVTAQRARVEVFDLLGRRVATLHDGALDGAQPSWRVETGTFGAGVYLVRAIVEQAAGAPRMLSQKFTVVR